MKARESNFKQNGREQLLSQNSVDLWLKRCQQLSVPPTPISEWNCSKDARQPHYGENSQPTSDQKILRCARFAQFAQCCAVLCTTICSRYWSPQKVSGHGLTPCNSRITQNWQHLGRTQNTVWFSETLFLNSNTRIRSHKKQRTNLTNTTQTKSDPDFTRCRIGAVSALKRVKHMYATLVYTFSIKCVYLNCIYHCTRYSVPPIPSIYILGLYIWDMERVCRSRCW